MITVSYLPQRHLYYAPIGAADDYPSGTRVGPVPGCLTVMGGLLLALDPTLGPLEPISETFRFGWLQQGDKKWGRLRDTDVQHLGATGAIMVENRNLSGSAPSLPIAHGRVYSLGGQDRLVSGIVPWGVDYEATSMSPMSSYFSPAAASNITFGGSLARTERLVFEGRYGVYECITHRLTTSYDDLDYRITSLGGAVCKFLYLDEDNTTVHSSAYIYALHDEAGHAYYDIPPARVVPGKVVAGPYAEPFLSEVITTFTDVEDVGPDDAQVRVKFVRQALQSPQMVGYVAQVFGLAPVDFDMGVLGQDVLRSWKYVDANILLTVFDLGRLRGEMSSWASLSKALKSLAKSSRKTTMRDLPGVFRKLKRGVSLSSNAYLGHRYGILPNVSDTMDLFEGFKKVATTYGDPQRVHARRVSAEEAFLKSTIDTTQTLTVEVDQLSKEFSEGAFDIVKGGKRWGLWPNLESLWDAVPYSFVCDWFVNLAHTLKQADMYIDQEYFPVQYCIMSTKRVWTPPLDKILPYDSRATGTLQFRMYTRWISSTLPLPPVQVTWGSGPMNHWLEAGALVVQRIL